MPALRRARRRPIRSRRRSNDAWSGDASCPRKQGGGCGMARWRRRLCVRLRVRWGGSGAAGASRWLITAGPPRSRVTMGDSRASHKSIAPGAVQSQAARAGRSSSGMRFHSPQPTDALSSCRAVSPCRLSLYVGPALPSAADHLLYRTALFDAEGRTGQPRLTRGSHQLTSA
jgi:hypothetical protein